MGILTRLASGGLTRNVLTGQTRAAAVGPMGMAYTSPGQPLIPEWDARTAVEQGYFGHFAVYRTVRLIADSIAGLPFRVGADPDKPGEYNTSAPLAQFLGPHSKASAGGPNPHTSARALWAWSIAQRIVTGRMGWELERDPGSGRIINLWPLVSAGLFPIPSQTTKMNAYGRQVPTSPAERTSYFVGYRYQPGAQPYIDLPADQVFYSWKPSQKDWREPETVMQAARIPISIAIALDRYNWGLLKNGMTGSKLIVTPPFTDPKDRRAFQEQFLAELTGFDNAGKPAFAEQTPETDMATGRGVMSNVQVVDLAQTAVDGQLMDLMRYVENCIYKAHGVDESMVGDTAERTYSNADRAYKNYWEGLLALIAEITEDVNRELAPQLGDDVGWFDLSKIEALKPQRMFQIEPASQLVDAHIVSAGEVREDYGLPYERPAEIADEPIVDVPAGHELPGGASQLSLVQDTEPARGSDVIARIDGMRERRQLERALRYDTSPVGTPGGKQNWVDKVGGLPLFIRAIAHALIRNGHSPSSAISIAVGRCKAWAAGEGNVSAKTRAKAAAAVAEWEAKKAASHAS